MKKTERNFKVKLVDYSDVPSCAEGMQLLFKLHQKRWKSKGLPGAFADTNFRNFHLEIAKIFAQRRQLGLFLLKLSDEPAAAIYGFKDQAKFYLYLSGFDPDYSEYRVGNQIIGYVMENCIKEELSEFDFMRGGEEYKSLWKTLSRWNRVAVIPRRGILSNTWYWLYTKIWNR